MAVDLLDSITHNRPSATVCENLRLCNTDAPSAFRSHLQATSNTILYTCSIRVTISCLHCPHVWIHYTRLFLVHKLMQCTLCWYSRLRNGPPQKFEKAPSQGLYFQPLLQHTSFNCLLLKSGDDGFDMRWYLHRDYSHWYKSRFREVRIITQKPKV